MPKRLGGIRVELKDNQALELRKAGATYEQIAQRLGYAQKSGAHHSVQRALKAARQARNDSADEYRELQLQRLDAYRLGLYSKATHGEPRAVEVALKIEEREANLLGLDAPKRQEISGPDGSAIQIEQEVVYSYEERQRRILAIVDSARARLALPVGSAGPDLDSTGRSADVSVADAG